MFIEAAEAACYHSLKMCLTLTRSYLTNSGSLLRQVVALKNG